MRIAHVSFEYPPDTALGGISTYVYQVSHVLRDRGHDVEVFCASSTRTTSEMYEGILVHRILSQRNDFKEKVLQVFSARQIHKSFDILESPEYGADGYEIKRLFPKIPLIVKLHTPSFLIQKLSDFYTGTPLKDKVRFYLGSFLRVKYRHPYWKWKRKEDDIEYQICEIADQIHTPSISLGKIVSEQWDIATHRIHHVPYPFIPDERFMSVPTNTDFETFTFIGRLEVRKGIIELVEAAKRVFDVMPEARFKLVGRNQQSHIPNLDMRSYIEQQLNQHLDKIEFLEVNPEEIPSVLAKTDVCVYPSLWENFPNVCLESMSAGKAIVGSIEGGMKDMLDEPKAGILIDPTNAQNIADAIISLLKNRELRNQLGEAARSRVISAYNSEKIGELVESKYGEAIHNKI